MENTLETKRNVLQKGAVFRHYKGGLYRIIGTAHHSETLELMVVYEAMADSKEFGLNALWVRPLEMFLDKVSHEGREIPRFEQVSQS